MAQENNAILCSDGVDNDNDGSIDCDDSDCETISMQGCDLCSSGISFADYLIDYQSGCTTSDPDPEGALGINDLRVFMGDEPEVVFLGDSGFIKLGFSNNLITNSGDDQLDIWVFEVGSLVEAITIAIRPKGDHTIAQLEANNFYDNGDGFYTVIDLGGATSGFDIDAIIPDQNPESLLFDAIQITDVADVGCIGTAPGADIDAVCALFFVETDCNCIPNGTAIIDDCGECNEPLSPEFNASCADCNNIPNGSFVLDDCGEWLDPNDPNFNQSCLDCNGVVNGLAILDDCGECNEPLSPEFNVSCTDCNGIPNGSFEIDDCGNCLDPNDPEFNQSCLDCNGTPNGSFEIDDCGNCLDPNDPNFKFNCEENIIYIPNVISLNTTFNNRFQVYASSPEQIQVIENFVIYDRWGNTVFHSSITDFLNFDNWWDGTKDGQALTSGVYSYVIKIEFKDNTIQNFTGSITLLH